MLTECDTEQPAGALLLAAFALFVGHVVALVVLRLVLRATRDPAFVGSGTPMA